MLDVIRQFLQRYAKEFDFYAEVARLAAARLEMSLDAAGVRAMVTYRAKHPGKLEEKIRQRAPEAGYTAVDQVYDDIVDLAGVRVALYFPGDRDLVGQVVKQTFVEIEPPREFPRIKKGSGPKKFSGYAATHYRVRLQTGDPEDPQARYATARVEIQVASVLMHGWAEVEHDLAYKPTQGDLSSRELALLDQLNGLVLAGEIALEQLQVAGQERVGELRRSFASHYDLAAHLIKLAKTEHQLTSVPEEGLGRVDLLFELLRRLRLDTPESIAPYLQDLHADLERRPLAEQVIDALLAEDGARYEDFAEIRNERATTSGTSDERRQFAGIGRFLSEWIKLETLVRADPDPKGRSTLMPTGRSLSARGLLDNEAAFEFDQLRRLRNMLVHGIEVPPDEMLHDATRRVRTLIELLSNARLPRADGEGRKRSEL